MDIAIIGGGPAGLTAGLYAARAGLSCALFEGYFVGGQASTTNTLENYPGFPNGVGGPELMSMFQAQAERAGLRIIYEEASALSLAENPKTIITASGEYNARAVVLAMGARRIKLAIPGEEENIGRGVSYCATCDGALYAGREVVVIGGGDTAIEDANYLATRSRVTLLHRRNELRAVGAGVERARNNPNIAFALGERPQKIERAGERLALFLESGRVITTDGIFVAIGTQAVTELVAGQLELDASGAIIASEDARTPIPGVFAAGDVRKKPLKQVATAVSDGAEAGSAAAKYIAEGA